MPPTTYAKNMQRYIFIAICEGSGIFSWPDCSGKTRGKHAEYFLPSVSNDVIP